MPTSTNPGVQSPLGLSPASTTTYLPFFFLHGSISTVRGAYEVPITRTTTLFLFQLVSSPSGTTWALREYVQQILFLVYTLSCKLDIYRDDMRVLFMASFVSYEALSQARNRQFAMDRNARGPHEVHTRKSSPSPPDFDARTSSLSTTH